MPRKARSVDLTQVSEWDDGKLRRKDDYLAAEEPLEIRVGSEPLSVTMRTPGHDRELAAGFLFTEGLVQRREQLVKLESVESQDGTNRGNVIEAELAPESAPDFVKMRRHFFAGSSCGICGKASIDSIRSRCSPRRIRISGWMRKCSCGCRMAARVAGRVPSAPAVFTPRLCSTRAANYRCCARISAGTTLWIK